MSGAVLCVRTDYAISKENMADAKKHVVRAKELLKECSLFVREQTSLKRVKNGVTTLSLLRTPTSVVARHDSRCDVMCDAFAEYYGGTLGFALEQNGLFSAAEKAGLRGTELNPLDNWA